MTPDIDGLAAALHEGWLSYMVSAGFVHGSVADVQRRTHPELRPWNELSDRSHLRERTIASALVSALEALRYRIVAGQAASHFGALTLSAACAALVEPLSLQTYRAWLALRSEPGGDAVSSAMSIQDWRLATSEERRRQDAAAVTGFLTHLYASGFLIAGGGAS